MTGSVGASLPGAAPQRIPYGQEKRGGFAPRTEGFCHDCGVALGELHHEGCDWEECETCGSQRIGCSCCVVCRAHEKDGTWCVCERCIKLAGAALEAGPSEPTVVNPASGVTIPMRDGWVWACARLQLLEGALRGNAATLEVWRAEESVRGGSLPPQVDTPKSTLWEREMRPPLPNEAGILAAIQRVLDSHEAQSPRAILNAIRGVGSRGQEP